MRSPRRSPGAGAKLATALVAITAILLVGWAAAYSYDSSRKDVLAEGITVGGIDVGGMKAKEARRVLEGSLATPLLRPVTVSFEGRTWTLTVRRARLHADIDGMVAEAQRLSREGSLPTRVARLLRGGEVRRDFPNRISYSKPAVRRFVKTIAEQVDRTPINASVQPRGSASLVRLPGKSGRELRRPQLRSGIERALTSRSGSRQLSAKARPLQPDVSTSELPQAYPFFITVDRTAFKLRLFKNLQPAKTYTVAVGQVGFDTPTGLYQVQSKQVDAPWHVPNKPWAGDLAGKVIPGGDPENPLKARWMAFHDGAGIHGTDDTSSLGRKASHGCIRMAIPDVIELYDEVPVGTAVFIG